MRIDVKRYMVEINRLKTENEDALEYIKAKEEECFAETKDAKDWVEWNNKVINLFGGTPVVVDLEDIIDELANIIGVEKGNMDVKLNVQHRVMGCEYSETKSP